MSSDILVSYNCLLSSIHKQPKKIQRDFKSLKTPVNKAVQMVVKFQWNFMPFLPDLFLYKYGDVLLKQNIPDHPPLEVSLGAQVQHCRPDPSRPGRLPLVSVLWKHRDARIRKGPVERKGTRLTSRH